MEAYVRFNNSPSPFASRAGSLDHGAHDGSDSMEDGQRPILSRVNSGEVHEPWYASWGPLGRMFAPKRTTYESGYLTLIPLSDARLKPRRTKLLVGSLLLLALAAVVGVFLAVPRGVSVGTIDVHTTKMTFNATTMTYRILLLANVPVFNPNYVRAKLTGNLTVLFYDAEAGTADIKPIFLDRRSSPQLLGVKVDASNLPRKYTSVVYSACFEFPRKIIFFLRGQFQAEYLGGHYDLPMYDTYFVLDCSEAARSNAEDGGVQEADTNHMDSAGWPPGSTWQRQLQAIVPSGA